MSAEERRRLLAESHRQNTIEYTVSRESRDEFAALRESRDYGGRDYGGPAETVYFSCDDPSLPQSYLSNNENGRSHSNNEHYC